MEKRKDKPREHAPVPAGHDERGKKRMDDPAPHSRPAAPDGISGYWE